MKILMLNSSDSHGGAAKSAFRLFTALQQQGISVKMLVRDKSTNDPNVILYNEFERKGILGDLDKFVWKIKNRIRKQKWKKYPNRESVFLNDLDAISLLRAIKSIDFDVLHLHFVANRFLDVRELVKINKPIVWTLHDSWAFTGICHFSYSCKRYEQSCGACPMLHSQNPTDFTHKIWKVKNNIYAQCNINVITPSNWLGQCASKSSLLRSFPLTVIPNGIDTELYKPGSKISARENLGLDADKWYLLFGAVNATSDSNKGFDLLVEALEYLKQSVEKEIHLIIFGADESTNEFKFDFPTKYMGYINDEEKMVDIYRAANLVIVPSRSENFSNAILESMACGIPVVAFNIGGNSDLIDHCQNGYLANAFDSEDLARGISWCMENENNDFSTSARQKVLKISESNLVATRYIDLYNTVLK